MPAFYLLLGRLAVPRARRLLFLALVLAAPVYIYYSRAFLMDSMALLCCAWFLLGFVRTMDERKPGWLAFTIVAGTLAALVCYFIARDQHSQLLLAVSYSGFFLNLFNLIPLPPFDGGRITAAISRRVWFIGVPIMGALFLWRPSPLLLLMAILAAPQLWQAWKTRHEQLDYYNVPPAKRLEYSLLYVGLMAYLAVMSHEVH